MFKQIANFFVWYYLVKVKSYASTISDKFSYSMNKTSTADMVKNLNKPLYQDYSSFGKSFSMFIRFWWIGFGTLYSLITLIPRTFCLLVLIVLPIVPVIQLINLIV